MPSEREQIETTLDQLELKLREQQLDPESRASGCVRFSAKYRATLNRPAPSSQPAAPSAARQAGSLVGRLGDTALHFEETHPALSTSLGAVATWLGQMGF